MNGISSSDANVSVTVPAGGSVGTGNLADGAVTAAKLASNAVTTAKVLDGNITDAKLASSMVHYFTKTLDPTATGATTVFTPTAAFLITGAWAVITAKTGSGDGGTGSMGQTGASYADIVASGALTALTAANLQSPLTLLAASVVAANAPVKWNQTVGSAFTTATLEIVVQGIYL